MIEIDNIDELIKSPEVGEWIAAHTPPADEIERHIRAVLDHDEWNAPHTFRALSWNGAYLGTPVLAVIDPAIDPPDYPRALNEVVARSLSRNAADHSSAPIVAYTLQIEAHGVELTPEQRAAVDRHALRTLPEAIEQCFVMTADLAGRAWTASKRRDTGEVAIDGPDSTCTGHLADMVRSYAAVIPPMYVVAEHARDMS
jgi:hypothetical protein